jgi:hypothetical protein
MTSVLAPTADNFDIGMTAMVSAVFLLLIIFTVGDIVLEWQGLQPIGRRVQLWSRANPIAAAVLIGMIGALLAHFFGNALTFKTLPNS